MWQRSRKSGRGLDQSCPNPRIRESASSWTESAFLCDSTASNVKTSLGISGLTHHRKRVRLQGRVAKLRSDAIHILMIRSA